MMSTKAADWADDESPSIDQSAIFHSFDLCPTQSLYLGKPLVIFKICMNHWKNSQIKHSGIVGEHKSEFQHCCIVGPITSTTGYEVFE